MEILKLFSNCIPVQGAKRAIVCDLQRNIFEFAPNSLVKLFDKEGNLNTNKIAGNLDKQNKSIFDQYISFLHEKEFVFPCEQASSIRFPKLNLEWDYPGQISNCIIDISPESQHDFEKLLNIELRDVNCKFIQFRHFGFSNISFWKKIGKIIANNEILAVDILLNFSRNARCIDSLCKWAREIRKIRNVVIHSHEENSELQRANRGFGQVLAIKEKITTANNCGCIHEAYFATNIETFTEAQLHNTCLNRKISIDVNGEIKNCPSMAKSYGNIRDTKLIDVANDPEFQKVWHIHKDQVQVCRDCEFRYICTDCRAYLEDPEDMYSKPLKCGYNPYTCEWEEWSTNPLKQKAIDFYGMRELVQGP